MQESFLHLCRNDLKQRISYPHTTGTNYEGYCVKAGAYSVIRRQGEVDGLEVVNKRAG